jgi:hypothetical protein
MRGGTRRRKKIWKRDWHMRYRGSRSLTGGSLHSASNLVYDHSCVYRDPPDAEGGNIYV